MMYIIATFSARFTIAVLFDVNEFFLSGTSYDNWETKSYLKSRENAPLEISKQPPLGPSKRRLTDFIECDNFKRCIL